MLDSYQKISIISYTYKEVGMRCVVIISTLCAITGLAQAKPRWVYFDSNKSAGTPPSIEVLSSDFTQTTIKITIPGMWVKDTVVNSTTYQILTLPETPSHTGLICKPLLPSINKLVGIPPRSAVSVDTLNTTSLTFSDYLIFPYQGPLAESEKPGPFVIDTLAYSSDSFYPETATWVGSPAILRDLRIVKQVSYPILFNPQEHKLLVFKEMTVQLSYSGFDNTNALKDHPRQPSPQFERMYREIVINYDYITKHPAALDAPPYDWHEGYLIICADAYYNSDWLDSLKFWKTKEGYICGIKKQSEIVGGYDANDVYQIRDYIASVYQQPYKVPDIKDDSSQLSYVLLVGDAPQAHVNYWQTWHIGSDTTVPTYGEWIWHGFLPPYNDANIPSDFYYSLIAGNDSFPDIAIGRLCATNDTNLETVINKTFKYERDVADSWDPTKVLLVAHRGPEDFASEKTTIKTELLDPLGIPVQTVYGSDGGTNAMVINSINSGLGVINYLGHGEPRCWSLWSYTHESFTNNNIYDDLTNEPYFPLVFNVACWTGTITGLPPLEEEAMVKAWTWEVNGGGVGAFGASYPSWTRANLVLDKAIFKHLFYLNAPVGWAINMAKSMIIEIAPPPPDQEFEYFLTIAWQYFWIGDPNLRRWEDKPASSVAAHPVLIHTSPTNFTVQVFAYSPGNPTVPVQGASVCLFKPFDVHKQGYTNGSGLITFQVDCQSAGQLFVTATGQCDASSIIKPYEGSCLVIYPSEVIVSETTKTFIPWSLSLNRPNPFVRSTNITFQVGGIEDGTLEYISIKVYNPMGQVVKTLIDDFRKPGRYAVLFDGKDEQGRTLSSGIYFYRLQSGGFKAVKRMVLLR